MSTTSPFPRNWTITPPTLPLRVSTWNASVDYPMNCKGMTSTNIDDAWAAANPPGLYCTTSDLNIGGDLSSGDGYTFFALSGSAIHNSSNGSKFKFYWPSSCGQRPSTRTPTFTCFGRTIETGVPGQSCAIRCYDPQTLFFSTSTASGGCGSTAICLSGSNNSIIGDIFAPLRAGSPQFPPPVPPGSVGAGVSISGGGNSAGSGVHRDVVAELQRELWQLHGDWRERRRPRGDRHCTLLVPAGNGLPAWKNSR